jgi:pimeloyl-ACP methyl ester carboxylesterase
MLIIRLITLLFIFFTGSCIQFRQSNLQIAKEYVKESFAPSIQYIQTEGREIRYLELGKDSLGTLFFIHGSPSSATVFNPYFKDKRLSGSFKILAPDRPGYGYSGFGKAEKSIAKQSKMLTDILRKSTLKKPIILIGTSYGGPIAAKIAMDSPDLVDGIVWVSPALGPGLEKIYNISYPVEIPIFNWMIPRMLRVANVEKLNHKAELKKLLPDWPKIKVPCSLVFGDEDELVYPENAAFAKKSLINAPWLDLIKIPGGRHFLQWDYKELIVRQILKHQQNYQLTFVKVEKKP